MIQRRLSTEFREKENLKQRERNAQRRLSTEFREKENLKQSERNAQRRLSTEFREKENLKQRSAMHKGVYQLNSGKRRI